MVESIIFYGFVFVCVVTLDCFQVLQTFTSLFCGVASILLLPMDENVNASVN